MMIYANFTYTCFPDSLAKRYTPFLKYDGEQWESPHIASLAESSLRVRCITTCCNSSVLILAFGFNISSYIYAFWYVSIIITQRQNGISVIEFQNYVTWWQGNSIMAMTWACCITRFVALYGHWNNAISSLKSNNMAFAWENVDSRFVSLT